MSKPILALSPTNVSSAKYCMLRDQAGNKRPYFAYLVAGDILTEEDKSDDKYCRGSKAKEAINAERIALIKQDIFQYFPLKPQESFKTTWLNCISNIDSRLRKRTPNDKPSAAE